MKTIEERAERYANDGKGNLNRYHRKQSYIRIATEQKTIERDTLNEIYDLYSKLIDDLYDGYLESGWNMGIVDINGEERNMGEMLDLLNNKFRKAMEE